MIFELRRYRVASGRMPDVHARFTQHLPPLFERHHLNVLGHWSSAHDTSVDNTSAKETSAWFIYLLGFDRLDTRQMAWGGFYVDPQWQQVRAATNAGSEMIERTALSFLSPSAACDGLDARLWSGGIHELIDQRVAIGRKAEVEKFLSEVYVPAVRASGADVLWLAEAITGEDLPQFNWILRWRNVEDRSTARPLLEETIRRSGSLLMSTRSTRLEWLPARE